MPDGVARHLSAGRRSRWPAIEMALLDLRGQAAGVPAWRSSARNAPSRSLQRHPHRRRAGGGRRAGASAGRRGFATFKLKVGVPGDVAQVAAVREAVGPEARIRVDANGAWSRG